MLPNRLHRVRIVLRFDVYAAVRNAKERENPSKPLVAATLEKAMTYVFPLKTDKGNCGGEWSPVEFLALISHDDLERVKTDLKSKMMVVTS
jgi:hypothetical protein